MGRGGAFVAGADDLGAIFYNPAGLAFQQSSFMLGANFGFYSGFVPRGTTPEPPKPALTFDPDTPDMYNFFLRTPVPLARMNADGITHGIVICMAPQNSRTSVGLYRSALQGIRTGSVGCVQERPARTGSPLDKRTSLTVHDSHHRL